MASSSKMSFFLTQKVDFQVEGVSPRTSQILQSEDNPASTSDGSVPSLKSKTAKSSTKSKSQNPKTGIKCNDLPRHDHHARKLPERKPHLRAVKTARCRKKSNRSVDKNEVFKLCVHPHRKRGSSASKEHIQRDIRTPTAEEIKLIEDISHKLPEKTLFDILCGHFAKVGSHTRDEFLRRAIKWRRGTTYSRNNSHCIICYLQRLVAQPIQTDYNRITSCGFSAKKHYDRYSRVNLRRNQADDKDMLNICKKADLMLKNSQDRKTPPPPPPGSSALSSTPSKLLLNMRETPDSEYSETNADRLLQIYMQPRQRDIHHRCQPRLPPFLLNSGRLPPEMAAVYKRKALRGGFLKKDHPLEKDKNRTDAEIIKQITYPICSLGLSFTLPQHNKNISVQRSATSPSIKQPIMYKPALPILPPIKRNISINVKIG